MIVHDKTGGRTVHLFIPFEVKGKKVESITFSPMRFGHTMRWAEGAWKTSFELLVELAGVDEAVIRELRYPDADRVMEAFLSMMPPDIRDDITNGRVPTGEIAPAEPPKDGEEPTAAPPTTNGSGQLQPVMPGAPLPPMTGETGFDLSDEQP